MDLNFKSCPSGKQSQSPCSDPPRRYQELSTDYDWPVKSIGHSGQREIRGEYVSSYLLSPLGAQNKDMFAVLQTLLTTVR